MSDAHPSGALDQGAAWERRLEWTEEGETHIGMYFKICEDLLTGLYCRLVKEGCIG